MQFKQTVKTKMGGTFYLIVVAIMLSGLANAEEVAGTVKSVKGEVNIVRDNESIKAATGMELHTMDKIVTGKDSAVGITLRDATLLSFGPKSTSQLNEFNYDPVKRDGGLLISVLKGSMRFVTGLLGKHNPNAVAIRLPTATLGVRGTDFIVDVEGGE